MNWARLSFVLLLVLAASVFAGSPPPQPCFFVPRHTIGGVGVGGGAGENLSGAPFITYAENASLTHAVPVSRLNVSIIPAQADNFSLSLGNASSYWAGSHTVNAYVVSLCLSGDCRVAWPAAGVGEVYNGTFNETEGVYVYNSTDWRIDFNETKLNQTIDERLNSTTYYPAAFNVDAGVLTGGNLASLFYYDGDTLNVTEAAGANPLIVVVNFTGVEGFDWLLIRERYDGGQGHEVYVQIWNFVGLAWDTYYIISDQAELVSLPPLYVADASEHISATNVSMRFFHLQNGIPAHDLHVDFVQLLDGFSTTTTITHDSLSSRNLDVNHLQYLNRNATRTLLNDWNVGDRAVYNITNFNATNASINNLTVTQNFSTNYVDSSLIPHASKNSSLSLGNASNYFSAVHASNGFYLFLSVAQQLNAFNASFTGNVSVSQNDAQLQPQLEISQAGSGDSAILFDVHVAGLPDNVSIGLDNDDNDNFEISNSSTLTGTTYSDENTLLRVHTEAGSEGIVDFNHQSRARAYLDDLWPINGLTWEQVNLSAETWDEKDEYDNAVRFRFTALEEGYYVVDVQLWVEAVWNWEAQLRRNDVSVVHTHMAFYSASDLPESESIIHIHDTVHLSATQYLEVWAYNDNPGGIAFITPGEDRSYFTVHKIS